jgi:hypothetical protein
VAARTVANYIPYYRSGNGRENSISPHGSLRKKYDHTEGRLFIIKVKTFMSPLKIFHTVEELSTLNEQVNKFIAEQAVKNVVAVSDTCTTDNTGASIGVIRVVTYET